MQEYAGIVLIFTIFVFSAIIHECSHGWAALKLGDPTAKFMGRLTLNPIPHIDPYMTIILPLMVFIISSMGGRPIIFGGAKPVPINYARLQHPQRDIPLISLAGPGSNYLMAIIVGIILRLIPEIPAVVIEPLFYFILINVLLGTFNLIPIPPLDGSKVLMFFLPQKTMVKIFRFERYGFMVLMILIFFTPFFSYFIRFVYRVSAVITGL